MSDATKTARIVVIGGGTGSFTILRGLKQHTDNITALVNMADDGGSTGQLRDELGALPPGDVRQCLVALSDSAKLRDLFNYRFDHGALSGHALGNLFLTALEKMTGNFAEAVKLASEVLAITGRVEPITLDNVKLCMKNSDGRVIKSQFTIGNMADRPSRPNLWLEPAAHLNPAAKEAIMQADLVVIAPGRLYGSLAPALLVGGVREALQASKAVKMYVCNLVSRTSQSEKLKVHELADEIERFVGAPFLDYVLYNNTTPAAGLLTKYASEQEFAVEFDEAAARDAGYKAIGADLLASDSWNPGSARADTIASTRSFIRHDPDKAAGQIMKILDKQSA